MSWVVGILGFIGGFVLGQYILMRMLKDRSREELIRDKSLHWRYGLLNWAVAAAASYAALSVFKMYFPEAAN